MHAKHVRIMYTPKSIFAYQYHKFAFLFGLLFIRIFMSPGSILLFMPSVNKASVKKMCACTLEILNMCFCVFVYEIKQVNMSGCFFLLPVKLNLDY